MTKYDLDGLFIDFYGESVAMDMHRPHQHLPFTPLAVGYTEFIKELFDWCEANGKVLFLNSVNPAIPILHLCHGATADSGGIEWHTAWTDKLFCTAAGKRHNLLPYYGQGQLGGLTAERWVVNGTASMFYAVLPSPWNGKMLTNSDHQQASEDMTAYLQKQNAPLAAMLADATPMGGSMMEGRLFWLDKHASLAFITLSNQVQSPQDSTTPQDWLHQQPGPQEMVP